MQLEVEKIRPKADAPQPTPNPEGRKPREINARMQFYATHNAGEQLRRASPARTGRKQDRMEGR
jgi:hypothetical protein